MMKEDSMIDSPMTQTQPDASAEPAACQNGAVFHQGKTYELIRIRTSLQKEDSTTGLSFIEGEHDIPFPISRFYMIFESEQKKQTGFHAHKQSFHLFFCPYGAIDVCIDTGKERKVITLDSPSVGLLLHPGVWREMIWRQSGSVLCVAASGHYDADRLRNNYEEYLSFLQEKEKSAE